jgi:apolipoprotein N-acyltransferase
MGTFAIFFGAFLAWLMWSSKGQKESFLSFAWVAMLAIGLLRVAYLAIA